MFDPDLIRHLDGALDEFRRWNGVLRRLAGLEPLPVSPAHEARAALHTVLQRRAAVCVGFAGCFGREERRRLSRRAGVLLESIARKGQYSQRLLARRLDEAYLAEAVERVRAGTPSLLEELAGILHAAASEEASERRLAQLLARTAAGEATAFTVFFEETAVFARATVAREGLPPMLAEEAVAEAYFQIWREAGAYDPARGSVRGWLATICRSRARDALRREAVRSGHRLAATLGGEGLDEATWPAEETWTVGSVPHRLHAWLAQLPATQRQLIGYAYFRGFSHDEISRVLDMPLGSVKSGLHGALARLRRFARTS